MWLNRGLLYFLCVCRACLCAYAAHTALVCARLCCAYGACLCAPMLRIRRAYHSAKPSYPSLTNMLSSIRDLLEGGWYAAIHQTHIRISVLNACSGQSRILIAFLNALFEQATEPGFEKHVITDLNCHPGEHLGILETDRRAVFDVYCETESGKNVEMQNSYQQFCKDRSIDVFCDAPLMAGIYRGSS